MVDWNNRSFEDMAKNHGKEDQPGLFGNLLDVKGHQADNTFRQQSSPDNGSTATQAGQWRQNYGGVAPDALQATSPNNPTNGQNWETGNPSVTTSQGANGMTWRQNYGGVAPGAIDATSPNNPNNQQQGDGGANTSGSNGNGGLFPTQPWAPSQNGPGSDGTGTGSAVSPNGATGGGGVDSNTRAIIMGSLHSSVNIENYLTWSAIGGVVGSGPLPWAADRVAAKLSGSAAAERIKSMPRISGFFDAHSPARIQMRTMAKENTSHEVAIKQANEGIGTQDGVIRDANQLKANVDSQLAQPLSEFNAGNAEIDKAIANAQVKGGKASGDVAVLWKQKENFLANAKANAFSELQPLDVDAVTLTGRRTTPTDGKFLTPKEATVIKNQINLSQTMQPLTESKILADGQIAQATDQIGVLKGSISEHQAAIGETNKAIDAIAKSGKSDFNFLGTKQVPGQVEGPFGLDESKITTKLGEGVAIGAAALGTDYLVDKALGHTQWNNSHDWFLEGPAVSAGLLVPGGLKTKLITTIGSIAAAQALDHFMPGAPSATYSKIMQPNIFDTAGTALAWMLPAETTGARIAAVGGAYALGRVADVLHNYLHLPIPGVGNTNTGMNEYNDMTNAVKDDANGQSNGKFQDIVNKGTQLGMENEAALMLQYSDFQQAHQNDKNPVYYLHGIAGIQTAIGNFSLERGTKINNSSHNTQDRILAGSNLDLGGAATQSYRAAAGNLISAENYLLKNHGSQDQINEMKDSVKSVQDKLGAIYGKHDINNAYTTIQTEFRNNISDMAAYQVALTNTVNGIQTNDKDYAAKMARDLALVDMAIAGYQAQHNNGGDAAVMYSAGAKYLQIAKQLSPNAADNDALTSIANNLSKDVPQATQNQNNNSFNNPFGAAPKS